MAFAFSKFPSDGLRALACLAGFCAIATGACVGTTRADDKIVRPPYLVTGSNHVIVGVVWEEAAVRGALPSWLKPAEGMTGAINIFQAERGYGLGSYQGAYFWVDVEGFDSASGIKGRWMLQGVYGPAEKISASYRQFYQLPVRNGTSRFELTPQGKRAIGTVDGHDFVTVEINSSTKSCQAGSVTLNYPTPEGVLEVPAAGDVCEAEPVSVEVHARPGDPFAAFRTVKVLWAIEFRNGAFSNSHPVPYSQYERTGK